MFRKSPLAWRRLLRDQDGAIAIWFVLCLLFFVPLMALAIDMPYGMFERARLQTASSASALAAVTDLVDTAPQDGVADNLEYLTAGVAFAYKSVGEGYGTVVDPNCGTYNFTTGTVVGAAACGDIEPGHWDSVLGEFAAATAGGPELNAVRVRTRRTEDYANPLSTLLAGAVGLGELAINTEAIAWAAPAPSDTCILDGIAAGNILDIDLGNQFLDGVCLYGQDRFEDGDTNTYDYEDGTVIYLGNNATIEPPSPSSTGFDEALQDERTDETLLVDGLADTVADYDTLINNGDFQLSDVPSVEGVFPAYSQEFVASLPSTLDADTVYHVSGTAHITKDHMGAGVTVSNVAFIAGEVTVESDAVLRNVVILADDALSANPDVTIGDSVTMNNIMIVSHGTVDLGQNGDYGVGDCTSTKVTLLIMATDEISIGSNHVISNMIALTADNLTIGSDNEMFLTQPTGEDGEIFASNDPTTTPPALVRPTFQALNEISLQNDNVVTGCPPNDNPGGAAGVVYRLVE